MNPKQLVKKLVRGPLSHLGYDIVRMPRGLEVDYSWLVHFLYLEEVYGLIKDVVGDVVECGVGYGNSFFKLCCLAYIEDKGRKIYGFDSFEGFPEPSEEDASPRNSKKGEFNLATVDTIEKLLIQRGKIERTFVKNNVRLVKGFFEESLHTFDGRTVAFLHLDVDLYESYKVTLEYFWPKVAAGGVVLFDEYKQPVELVKWPGASKAIDEFFGDSRSQIRFNEQANRHYIVK